tara:strand:+ start:265 stop:639 length:375 start_codon:yes stop_codon:yes gene_type:complete
MTSPFDTHGFYAALNAVRRAKELPWKEVASQSGVNASTLSRIGQGANPDVEGLARLLIWSNLKFETFLKREIDSNSQNEEQTVEPLAEINSLIRSGSSLSHNGATLLADIFMSNYEAIRKAEKK